MGTAVDCAPLLKSRGLLGLQQLPGCCTTAEAAGLRRRPRCASCEGCAKDCEAAGAARAAPAAPAVRLRALRAACEY